MIPQQVTFVWPSTLIEIAVLIVALVLVRWVLRRLVNRSVRLAVSHTRPRTSDGVADATLPRPGSTAGYRQEARMRTLGTMLNSVIDITLVVVGILMVLNDLHVNVAPLLASAGVGGLAIGIGAQSLVRDFISGIFMVFEDQYGVGDLITVGNITGQVLSVGFRVTEVQDFTGKVWYLRNGDISTLGNLSQGWATSVLDFPAAPDEQPTRVMDVLKQVISQLDADPVWHAKLLEPPSVLGLARLDANSATYQVLVKTPADGMPEVEREVRARVAAAFLEAGINGPRQVITTISTPPVATTPGTPASAPTTSPMATETGTQTATGTPAPGAGTVGTAGSPSPGPATPDTDAALGITGSTGSAGVLKPPPNGQAEPGTDR